MNQTSHEIPRPPSSSSRVVSIDVLRGAAMVLMAIDHVRVFSGVPAGGSTPAVFFTRWVTHFCAPAFVFFAGTGASLYGRKHADVSRFLFLRGLWLVLLELSILRVAWTFNFDFAHYELAGVIWVIGWSMVLLGAGLKLIDAVSGGARYLPEAARQDGGEVARADEARRAGRHGGRRPAGFAAACVGGIGVAIIALHNLLDAKAGAVTGSLDGGLRAALWKIGYIGFFAGPIQGANGTPSLIVLYSLVPWIGVMAAGYGFGRIVAMEPARRNRICVTVGLGAIALFLVLRGFNLYGDPRPWSAPPTPARTAAPSRAPGSPAQGAIPGSQLASTPAGAQSAPHAGPPPLPALLSFLNTTKYPASLLFLLMTLGPTIALMPLAERLRGPVGRMLTTFGRVPLFFYLLHIPLIHALALIVSAIRQGHVDPWLFANHPMGAPPPPDGYNWGLPLLYLVWAIAIAILYPACVWFAGVKARRKERWLSYL